MANRVGVCPYLLKPHSVDTIDIGTEWSVLQIPAMIGFNPARLGPRYSGATPSLELTKNRGQDLSSILACAHKRSCECLDFPINSRIRAASAPLRLTVEMARRFVVA